MPKKTNPDKIIEALEAVCKRFNVTLKKEIYAGIVVYDKDGMEVCNFDALHGTDGPRNLEIGATYQDVYSTEPTK